MIAALSHLVGFLLLVLLIRAQDFGSQEIEELYRKFLSKHKKSFDRLLDPRRLRRFFERYELVQRHNAKLNHEHNFLIELNEFSDLFDEEVSSLFSFNGTLFDRFSGPVETFDPKKSLMGSSYTDLFGFQSASPNAGTMLNWATEENPLKKGVTGTIHYQGTCGACWAFVATASTEAAIKISLLESREESSKSLADQIPSLSAQELIDCDDQFNRGCRGGNPVMAFSYIAENGLGSELSYPYDERLHERCDFRANQSRYFISRIRRIVARNENAIRLALEDGPVSVGVCGTDLPFLFYASGIFDFRECCRVQNHAMLVVGYGHDPDLGLDYWIAQNSWGEHWGENGFMRILRKDQNDQDGVCGLALNPSQALDGYFVDRDGSVIVGSGVMLYLVPLYRAYIWLLDHWKPVTVVVALSLMAVSFVFLAYGLYLDRLVQLSLEARARCHGYQRIPDGETLELVDHGHHATAAAPYQQTSGPH